jgi:hypothetical protein
VSKIEKWLQLELPRLYPDLEFLFNKKQTIDAELDIYIPSLALAFELNGPVHYEPIYGEKRLKSAITNDKRKFLACAERRIDLCVIDICKIKNFNPQRGLWVLEIICNIIDDKINFEKNH